MDDKTYGALKRIIKHIKWFSSDDDINTLYDDIIKVSDWIDETAKDHNQKIETPYGDFTSEQLENKGIEIL